MNKSMVIGLVLIGLGVLALGYEGFSYVTQDKVLDLGSLEIDVEKKETIHIPQIAGIVFLVGGAITVAYSMLNSSSP